MFSLILSIYLRVIYMEIKLSILRKRLTVFQSGCTIYILTSSVGEGSSFSISSPTLVVIYLIDYNHLVDIKWYLIVVLICISLMVKDIEHLFMCILGICLSPLEKQLFRFFVFLIMLFVFLLLEMSSLCMLDTSPLSEIWFAHIFSPPMSYLFSFLMISFENKRF